MKVFLGVVVWLITAVALIMVMYAGFAGKLPLLKSAIIGYSLWLPLFISGSLYAFISCYSGKDSENDQA